MHKLSDPRYFGWWQIINWLLLAAANGFGIFLLRQFFLTISIELEQAASLDGANRWQILWRIMLPLSRPELRTVQLALTEFQEQFTNSWQ